MLDRSKIYVLMPTLNRPEWLRRALKSLEETARDLSVVVTIDPTDISSFAIARDEFHLLIAICEAAHMGSHHAWNVALTACPSDAQAFVLGSDDVIFQPGWIEAALKALESIGGSGVVGMNDDKHRNVEDRPFYWCPHYLMTRDFVIQHNGGVMAFECYFCDYTDVETASRAIRASKFIFCEDAHVTHLWPGHSKETQDDTFKRARTHHAQAQRIFEIRKACGFPDDFEPILTK